MPPAPGVREDVLVSVVIAAHNAADHLEQTCRSALAQAHQQLELIVVDDGSTDGTAAIVSRLAAEDSRVRLVQQGNCGVAAARNAGIALAQGEFIAPLDADDLWDVTKIARQLARFRECGPATGVVYAWWAWIDESGRVLDTSPRWMVEGRVLDKLIEVNVTGCASVPLFRKSCLDEAGGYDPSLRARDSQGCEDWDLILRVASRHEVAVAPAVLVGYRRRAGSMSNALGTMWRSQVAVTAAVAADHPELPAHALRRSHGQFALHLAGVSFWSGNYADALRWGLRARPFALVLPILPHVLRLLARRIAGARRGPARSWPDDNAIAGRPLPESLIPYDAICERHWRGDPGHGGSSDPAAALTWQVAGVTAAVALVAALHASNDGLWFQGDAPRHAATGLFYWDWLSSALGDPIGYALSYYARYPVIVPGAYPPLFHLLEGAAFRIAGPSPIVAKTLVWTFAWVAGLYTALMARRWIAPWAGWAGVLVLLLPGFVRYSNVVLLNVPATALGLGALYHLRTWLDSGRTRNAWWFVALGSAAVATYLPGIVFAPVAVVWLLASRRRVRLSRLWLLPLLGVAGLAVAVSAVPEHFARNAPSLARLFTAVPWRFYGAAIVPLLGWPWLVLGAAGLVAALISRARCAEALQVALAVAAVAVTLGSLPAMDERYALLLGPLTVLAALLGAAALLDRAGAWRRRAIAATVAAVTLLGVVQAATTRVPRVTGFDGIARELAQRGPSDAVLYSGAYDGIFGFYTRALDPGMQRRMVLTNKLLYRYQLNSGFIWEETPFVSTPADVIAAITQHSGCRWVAVEVGPEDDLPSTERLLREALRQPAFELAASFPVTAGTVTRVDLYRLRGPLAPAAPLDLQFPSFSNRVFHGVEPVTRDAGGGQ